MAINDKYQASVIFTSSIADGELVNVFHYELLNVGTPLGEFAHCNELAQIVGDVYVADLLTHIADDFTLSSVEVFNQTQPQFFASVTFGIDGSSVAEPLSSRTAVVATKRTGFRGRSFRGRSYFCGTTEAQQVGGDLTTTYQADVQTLCDNLVSVLTVASNEYQLQVFSPTLIVWTPVLTFDVRARTGTIRGRRKVS